MPKITCGTSPERGTKSPSGDEDEEADQAGGPRALPEAAGMTTVGNPRRGACDRKCPCVENLWRRYVYLWIKYVS